MLGMGIPITQKNKSLLIVATHWLKVKKLNYSSSNPILPQF